MAHRLTATQVKAILAKASKRTKSKFILQVGASYQRGAAKPYAYWMRLKGNNGELIAHGEQRPTLSGVRNICARLIEGGLDARFKDFENPSK